MTSPLEKHAPQVAYDVAMRRLDAQMQQIDAIDSKVRLVIGAASGVITLFAGFAAVTIKAEIQACVIVGLVFMFLVILGYIPAIVLGVLAYRFREWERRPNWEALNQYIHEYSEDTMRIWVAEGCIESLKSNEPKIKHKVSQAEWAMRFLGAETLFSATGLLAIVITNAVRT
jgi:hypothetical protein